MKNKLEILDNCIAESINCLFVFAIMTVVLCDFVNAWSGVVVLLPFIPIPISLYLTREYVKSAILFFAIHFVIMAGVIVLAPGPAALRVLYILATGIYVLISIYRRMNSKVTAFPVFHPIVMACALFVLYGVDVTKGGGVAGVILIRYMMVYMLVYLGYYYLHKFYLFIVMNCKVTENIPVKRIFGTSAGLVGVFLVILCGMMLLLVNKELMDALAEELSSFILAIIAVIMRFITRDVGLSKLEKERIQEERAEISLGEVVPKNEWLSMILDYLAMIAGIVIAILLVILIVKGIITLIRDVFAEKKTRITGKEEFYTEKVESLKRERHQKEKTTKRPVYNGTPGMQARKVYFKTMQSKKPAILLVGKNRFLVGTARENTRTFLDREEKNREAAEMFYTTYEKARYGEDGCRKEELKAMKKSRDTLLKN